MKTNSITQLVKKSGLMCAHKFLGYQSGTSKGHKKSHTQEGNIKEDKHIDFIFVTPGILPSIIRGGYRPYTEGIQSDHRALYLDLDAETLFGTGTDDINIAKTRNLDTKYPKKKKSMWQI